MVPFEIENVGADIMSSSWIVVRIADQAVVGHYHSRREAAEKAYRLSQCNPDVAIPCLRPLGDAPAERVGKIVATARSSS